jgi:hypothetical protein
MTLVFAEGFSEDMKIHLSTTKRGSFFMGDIFSGFKIAKNRTFIKIPLLAGIKHTT